MHPAMTAFVQRAVLARRAGALQGSYSARTALGMLACYVDCEGKAETARFTLNGRPIRNNILNSALAKDGEVR
jgi:hypothetical protein